MDELKRNVLANFLVSSLFVKGLICERSTTDLWNHSVFWRITEKKFFGNLKMLCSVTVMISTKYSGHCNLHHKLFLWWLFLKILIYQNTFWWLLLGVHTLPFVLPFLHHKFRNNCINVHQFVVLVLHRYGCFFCQTISNIITSICS